MKNSFVFDKDKWFFEQGVPGNEEGVKVAIKIKKKIFSQKTSYQKIEIFDTFSYGRILSLDEIVQLSESDEFVYHEMFVHTPMFCHKNPKRVLIIGGGDGGVLREVLKHPVSEVYFVEIDKAVIDVCKKYFPFVSNGAFEDKRTKIFIEDGFKFAKKYKNFFDVIIVDSTDPVGPSLSMFTSEFYRDILNALTKDGVISLQTSCFIGQSRHLKSIYKKIKSIFADAKINRVYVPCFGCSGEWTFITAGKTKLEDRINILENRIKKSKIAFKYYSPENHVYSGIIPKYLQKEFKA